jgi:hypothetical protein
MRAASSIHLSVALCVGGIWALDDVGEAEGMAAKLLPAHDLLCLYGYNRCFATSLCEKQYCTPHIWNNVVLCLFNRNSGHIACRPGVSVRAIGSGRGLPPEVGTWSASIRIPI